MIHINKKYLILAGFFISLTAACGKNPGVNTNTSQSSGGGSGSGESTDTSTQIMSIADKKNRADLAYVKTQTNFQPYTNSSSANDFGTDVFILDPSLLSQQYVGVGSSIEEKTVYSLGTMPVDMSNNVLKKLYGNGDQDFNWNMGRVTFGTADVTPKDLNNNRYFYTYDDNNGAVDINLSNFNVMQGIQEKYWENNKLETLEQVKMDTMNKIQNIKTTDQATPLVLLGSVWSPPGWMKDNFQGDRICPHSAKDLIGCEMIGGGLRSEMLSQFAKYYGKILSAYNRNGIQFEAVTQANEPGVSGDDFPYPHFHFYSDKDTETLLEDMQTEITNTHLKTQVWVGDFNFGSVSKYLNAPYNQKLENGLAYHSYGGNIANMKNDFCKFNGITDCFNINTTNKIAGNTLKNVYLTEYMWNWANQVPASAGGAARLLEYFHQGSSSFIAWGTIRDGRSPLSRENFDKQYGDHTSVSCHEKQNDNYCTPNTASENMTYEYDFLAYALGLFSKNIPSKVSYALSSDDSGKGVNNYYDVKNYPEYKYSPANYSDKDTTGRIKAVLPDITQVTFEYKDSNAKINLVSIVANQSSSDKKIRIIFPNKNNNNKYSIDTIVNSNSISAIKWIQPN